MTNEQREMLGRMLVDYKDQIEADKVRKGLAYFVSILLEEVETLTQKNRGLFELTIDEVCSYNCPGIPLDEPGDFSGCEGGEDCPVCNGDTHGFHSFVSRHLKNDIGLGDARIQQFGDQ